MAGLQGGDADSLRRFATYWRVLFDPLEIGFANGAARPILWGGVQK